MIWEWHLVPRVPLSNNGFSYHTHWLSINYLAFMLSTALTIKSIPYQNSSLKYYSTSGLTFNLTDLNLQLLLIWWPILQATSLLFLPTWCFLNKNCLFKLLISMLSSSVHITLPSFSVLNPIKANILINSQPNAPAPIKNVRL